MIYESWSKAHLINRLEALETINQAMLDDQEKEISEHYAWSGNLGRWYFDLQHNTVTFNSLKATNLGYTKDELPDHVNYQFFTEKLHPDDYEKTMQAMRDHLSGKNQVYEIEYRIKTKDGAYKWYYDRGSIVKRDENGKPLLVVGIVFDITESVKEKEKLRIENKELTKQTNIDPLTKVANRRALSNHLTHEIARAKQNNVPLSIGMYDIDDFKQINDTEGHPYGDKVLVKIAEIMKEDLRDLDIVGRYGGEEFMIIFPHTKRESAKKVSDRIRKKIINAFKEDNKTITISGGVALYTDHLDEEAFIKKADDNLYKAKEKGKNRII